MFMGFLGFRRVVASFLIFLFIVVALPVFVIFALSRTFFDANFYIDKVAPPAYELFLNAASAKIYSKDSIIQKYFKPDDIHKIVAESISPDLFQGTVKDFAADLEQVKSQPDHPLTFNLKPYKENLRNIAQRLAIHLFQALPACKTAQLPEFNEDGIATCIPGGTNYDVVSGPLSKQFETSVLNSLPDTIDLSLARDDGGSVFTVVLSSADRARFYGVAALMVLIVVLAFVLYKPFSLIVRYEGMAFLFSGFLGFLMSLALNGVPLWVVQNYAQKNADVVKLFGGDMILAKYLSDVFGVFTGEVQKIALIFLILGAVLMAVYFFGLKKNRKEPAEN